MFVVKLFKNHINITTTSKLLSRYIVKMYMRIEVSYAYMCNTRRHNIGGGLPIISQHDLVFKSCLLYKRFRISSIILKDSCLFKFLALREKTVIAHNACLSRHN